MQEKYKYFKSKNFKKNVNLMKKKTEHLQHPDTMLAILSSVIN